MMPSSMNLNYIIFYLQRRLQYQNRHRNHLISLRIAVSVFHFNRLHDGCKRIWLQVVVRMMAAIQRATNFAATKVVANCIKARLWFNETRLACVTFFSLSFNLKKKKPIFYDYYKINNVRQWIDRGRFNWWLNALILQQHRMIGIC